MRRRLPGLVALAVLGAGVAFAVADGLSLVESRTVKPHVEVLPSLETAEGAAGGAEHDELGAIETGRDSRAAERTKRDRTRREDRRHGRAGDDDDQTAMLAALIPAGSGGGGQPLPCTDTNSCVDRVGRLITDVADRLPGLPRIRECTSSIGGKATCFDFGAGNYLVGDSPADGQAELGFCTASGYYYVSGPSLGGGTGGACPGGRPHKRERPTGQGAPPTPRECESLSGGDATCFDFSGGSYIVSDPLADGKGELGFCTGSGYYYVSAPSAEGAAGANCPAR